MENSDLLFAGRIRRTLFVTCIWTSLISLPANSTLGQANTAVTPKKPGPAEQALADAESRINVFALKHTEAGRLREVIEPLLLRIDKLGTVLEDNQTNRLIVRANSNGMLAVESIVKILDTPSDKRADQQLETKFIHLRSAPHVEMQNILRLFLSRMGRMSVDPAHNLVVVQDTAESVAKFEKALEDYDLLLRESLAMENAVQGDSTVRIVWLINGVRDAELAVPPDDLKGVIRDLAKLGIEDLRLAAQAIVKTTGGRHFEIQCSPNVGNPCSFEVEGELISKVGGVGGLNIRLMATEKVPTPNGTVGGQVAEMKRLCSLDATVRAPRGHTVVIGVAPTEKRTSVFVVQILAEEE